MKIRKLLTTLLLVFACATVSEAQLNKVAQTGLQFLKVDAGARASAMGGAMTLTSYDANAVFYNPAGLARMDHQFDLMFNHTQWIADINYNAVAHAYDFGDIGTFAVHALFADYGEIMGTRVASNAQGYELTGKLDVSAYSVGLSYARNLSEKFTIGGTVKYVGQQLGSNLMPNGEIKENKVDGFAFDFGTIFYPGWDSFRFGMSVRNFSAEFEYEQESFELPLTFSVGVAMDVFDMFPMEGQSLLVSVDAVHPRSFSERMKFGAEYTVFDMISLRAGYKTNHDNESFSGGIGLFHEFMSFQVKIDYSYSAMEYFDGVNRFTIGLYF